MAHLPEAVCAQGMDLPLQRGSKPLHLCLLCSNTSAVSSQALVTCPLGQAEDTQQPVLGRRLSYAVVVSQAVPKGQILPLFSHYT